MNKLLISAAAAVATTFALAAHADDSVENTKEAMSQSAKATESAVKSKTADSKAERFVHKHKARYHKERAKSAAKAATR